MARAKRKHNHRNKILKEVKIPEGFAWVIGDNRNLSWYGMVEIKNIKGLVIF